MSGELKDGREELFVREFIRTNNGTASAIAAGYAPSGAHVRAATLLRRPRVQARILELRDAQRKPFEEKVELSREWLLEAMTKIAKDALEANDRPSAIKACEMLGRECGVFLPNQKVELTGRSPLDGLSTLQLVKLLDGIDKMSSGQQLIDVTPAAIDADFASIEAPEEAVASDVTEESGDAQAA